MKRIIPFLLLSLFTLVGCDKSLVKQEEIKLPVTEAVKGGRDWMITLFENSASLDIGLTFLKFNTAGSVVATQDGANYTGTWSETNTGGNNTLQLNITTTNSKLLRVNRTWKVVSINEYNIDLKDADVSSKATIQLMKH